MNMRKEHEMDEIMTIQDVAKYLKIKERTIYDWLKQKKIPGFKVGNNWRFKFDDIQSWIEENKITIPSQNGSKVDKGI